MTTFATTPRPTRLLVVDDAEGMRELIRARLRHRDDLQVVGEATDGIEAIERAEDLQPDLVICDVTMPHLNGIDAIASIRRAAPQARIMMMSSLSDQMTIQRALHAGADDYVIKGLSRDKFLARIDDLIS